MNASRPHAQIWEAVSHEKVDTNAIEESSRIMVREIDRLEQILDRLIESLVAKVCG